MLRQQWQKTPPLGLSERSSISWLSDLGAVSFEGPDAAAFLQGYLTSDTDALSQELMPTALCDLHGRVVANGYVSGNATEVVLIVHISMTAPIIEFLARYLPFSKTTATDRGEEWLIFGDTESEKASAGLFQAIDARHALAIVRDEADAADLRSAGLNEENVFWQSMIEHAQVMLSLPVSGQFLPQMLNLTGAVDFAKGCYLGQEIVARAQHRGKVKRRLTTLASAGQLPSPGETLIDLQGHKRGTVINCTATSAEVGVALVVTSDTSDDPFETATTRYSLRKSL